jgi:hypothetical protein
MSRTHVAAILVVSALALPGSTAFPQTQAVAPSGAPTTSRQGVVGDNIAMCQGTAGGSRIRPNCEPEATVRQEHALKIWLDPPPRVSGPRCEATATTNYFQTNAVVSVAGTINIGNCSMGSAGTYDIVIRVRDEKGHVDSLEFSDKWQRSDGQNVEFAADYQIGQDVELVNVRMHDLRCTCADSPVDPASDLWRAK